MFAAMATGAQADEWPTKTVKLIVPYAAGGTTDITTRKIAELLTDKLDENIIVENRPGAGSTKGTSMLAKGRGASHVLLMASPGHVIGPAIYPGIDYDPVKDFKFIRNIIDVPNVMVVSGDSPYNTVAEFIEDAKNKEMTFGSSGVGGSLHMSGELLKSMTGLNLTHVPFRGSGESVPAVISGDVDFSFENLPVAMPHIKAGKMKALAVTTAERSPYLPDVPTMQEAGKGYGLETFKVSAWFGLIAHKSFSEEASLKMQKLLDEVIKTEDFKEFMKTRGAVAGVQAGDDFKAFIQDEVKKWAVVAEKANVKK
ncbi:MAG: tripartite tricarboxylate transporter substrate binding protein [Methylocystaceae bacterium]|nr:tripartite tricarboxylate transporter substrate binding protein [Methylocystaceae bacterium]